MSKSVTRTAAIVADLEANAVGELAYYPEDPHAIKAKLDQPDDMAVTRLRRALDRYMTDRRYGAKTVLSHIDEGRIDDWADKQILRFVAKTITLENIKRFRNETIQKPEMPNLFCIHCYLWISCPEYRSQWGSIQLSPLRDPVESSQSPSVGL